MRLVLSGATLIDGRGGRPIANAEVVVEADRIIAVGSAGELADRAEAKVIDLAGKYLLPGFINAHDHLTTKRLRGSRTDRAAVDDALMVTRGIQNALVNLREGITTVRDAGAPRGLSLSLKSAITRSDIVTPRILAAAQGLTETAGYAHEIFVEVDTPLEAKKAAGAMIKRGADFIKCMASIEWGHAEAKPLSTVNMDVATMRAAFDLAHHHSRRCMAHALCDEAIANAVEAGADTIEHGVFLSASTARKMAKRGVGLVPTLSGYKELRNDWGRGQDIMRHSVKIVEQHKVGFRHALEAGVTVAFGSDSLGNLLDECRTMQEWGMPPMQCIEAITRNAAMLLGIDDQVGSIAAERVADLVVLDADPISNIAALGEVELVVKSGRLIDPAMLPV
ncbi:amidohydrolase family protein [Bradyrhizobium hipponense]|uniref:Amidohydrolase family protein n=1 Tax=Bradyrhizobium hipponense TaxID=2605638 RepID=A0A5S4YKH4_9BRAD|nr:amidohydrolase family protein [Bradyrhizobium hipponense]TYO64563.1 amidohydrolase family protein [Bradyrhizobium hipponense]